MLTVPNNLPVNLPTKANKYFNHFPFLLMPLFIFVVAMVRQDTFMTFTSSTKGGNN